MIRYLHYLLFFLALISCGPKKSYNPEFNIGECIRLNKWNHYTILNIQNDSYFIESTTIGSRDKWVDTYSISFRNFESVFHKHKGERISCSEYGVRRGFK